MKTVTIYKGQVSDTTWDGLFHSLGLRGEISKCATKLTLKVCGFDLFNVYKDVARDNFSVEPVMSTDDFFSSTEVKDE